VSPRPSPGPAAAEPGTSLDAGQAHVPGGVLDARYEQLRHAALHARAEAFPLGLGALAGKGVTAWRRALARLTCMPAAGTARTPAPAAPPPGLLPGPVTAELVHALAGLTDTASSKVTAAHLSTCPGPPCRTAVEPQAGPAQH
jgi:hypothetical protein